MLNDLVQEGDDFLNPPWMRHRVIGQNCEKKLLLHQADYEIISCPPIPCSWSKDASVTSKC